MPAMSVKPSFDRLQPSSPIDQRDVRRYDAGGYVGVMQRDLAATMSPDRLVWIEPVEQRITRLLSRGAGWASLIGAIALLYRFAL